MPVVVLSSSKGCRTLLMKEALRCKVLRLLVYWFAAIFFSGFEVAQAQTTTTASSEATALNTVFQKWGIEATNQWNISGELCSGVATDSTDIQTLNPGIKCDCSDRNGTLCHITGLRVFTTPIAGPIPDELWNLTFLDDLDLRQNSLSGPLSPSIGRLTRMQFLSFGSNTLTGALPKELGLLTNLESLSISANNFSGSLPPELGNLTRLTEFNFGSCGVSGSIPSTFANLRSLTNVWGTDNALTGQIPDFIGGWLQLKDLRLQGNAFEGQIPPSFANLTAMEDLRLCDISNWNYSLDFLANMTSINKLILRNNNISGTIPSFIGGFRSLVQLDLSFNNLTGSVPDFLFNLSSLTHLFLGNNKLTGTLPTQNASSSFQAIDLSYNELSGGFPSWIGRRNLQINLVANNFTITDSNSSVLPTGLNCLQRNFPCNRGSPRYSDFAIKCGGQQMTSSNQILYERDNETLGPATYYTPDGVNSRWAVSNVGLPSDSSSPQYTAVTSSQFTNTLDSELFQSTRVSAGSLRYYGLSLENGNYTVILQFAESTILNPPDWRSAGRRVFDVYIQGNLVLRDFDIVRSASAALRAVQRQYTVRVSENYLEIHLFWAGKGTCCVPAQGIYGPSISAISATPDFEPTVGNRSPSEEKNNTGLIVGIVVPVVVVIFIAVLAAYYLVQQRKRKLAEDEEFLGMDAKPYTFSYGELKSATNDFNPANKLGEGGFGPVFKGTLNDGRVVAVKQLSVASHQGKSQFVAEIATISAVQHRNLVKLYGCCIEGDRRLLVYEYHENKSLDQALFGKSILNLNWATRFEICLGVARGLAYLHEESRLRIVHRDVKASNILLDSDLNPKISDFGLAKLYDDKKTHISTRVAGTIGYLAPEYAMRGHLTEKADVFGFGVVALEIVSGRANTDPNLEEDKIYLLELAWQLHENNTELELVDTKLSDYSVEEVKRVIGVALLCTQTAPGLRPSMSRAVTMLAGDIEVPPVTTKPEYLTDWKFNGDTTSFIFSEADTSFYASSSTTGIADPKSSPTQDAKPILHEITG